MIVRKFILVVGALAALAAASPCAATGGEQALAARLSAEAVGPVEPGVYQAGDDVYFTLNPWHGEFLLQFDGNPEVFVLHEDRAPLGGRVLRYDTGAEAIGVAGWGGLTLYTDNDPDGLPAMRQGGSGTPEAPQPTLDQLHNAATDEAAHFGYTRKLGIEFQANWDRLRDNTALWRALFHAMVNTAQGIDDFAAEPGGGALLREHIRRVRFEDGPGPGIALDGRTLLVTYDGTHKFAGVASSRATSRALDKLLRASADAD